jgi:capsular polysaccharide biosynthesis protein
MYKRVRLEWLDDNRESFRGCLAKGEPGYSYGPVINGSQQIEQIQLGDVRLYHFSRALVSATSSSVFLNEKLVLERIEGVASERCNFAAGHVIAHDQNHALVRPRDTLNLARGIFLGGNGVFNYYHWMIEALPKLMYIEKLDAIYQDYPILVSDDVMRIPAFRESLTRMGIKRPVIALDKRNSYIVDHLIYISTPNNCPINLRKGVRQKISDFHFREDTIRYTREKLGINSRAGQDELSSSRIFFARKRDRRAYNQDQVFEALQCKGFVKVYMEDLSLHEQIELVSNSAVIAGPTGAAWTNLLFCREGSKALCWMAEESRDFSC